MFDFLLLKNKQISNQLNNKTALQKKKKERKKKQGGQKENINRLEKNKIVFIHMDNHVICE